MNIWKLIAGLGLAGFVIELMTRPRSRERCYRVQKEGLGFSVGDIITHTQLENALAALEQQKELDTAEEKTSCTPAHSARYCGNHWCQRELGPEDQVEDCLECHGECCEECAYIFSPTGSYCSYNCYMESGD